MTSDLPKVKQGQKSEIVFNALTGKTYEGKFEEVAIARALATEPQIILADEPTGALDSKSGKEILIMFSKLNKEGNTILIITHDKEIAKEANRVITIVDGEIISDDLRVGEKIS